MTKQGFRKGEYGWVPEFRCVQVIMEYRRVNTARGLLRWLLPRFEEIPFPLKNATVSIDGKVVGVTDDQGRVELILPRRKAEVTVEKIGYVPMKIDVEGVPADA